MIRQDWSTLKKLMFMKAAAGGAAAVEATATGNPLVFITDLARPLKSLLIPFTPQQEGTGDPSPENIRSILPWNGLKVWHGDVNWNQLIAKNAIASKSINGITGINNGDGSYTVSGTASALFDAYTEFQMQANHVYYVTGAPEGAENDTYQLYFNSKKILANGLLTKYTSTQFKSYDIIVRSGTALSGSKVFYPQLFDLTLMFGETFANALHDSEEQTAGSGISQIREILPKKYYAYKEPDENQHSYSLTETDIVFPSPVYGGTLDVVSGVLTVTHVITELNGTQERFGFASRTNTSRVMFTVSGLKPNDTNKTPIFSENSKAYSPDYVYSNDVQGLSENQNKNLPGIWVSVENSLLSETTVAGLLAYLEENPITVCYPLATPQEIQLTPTQLIALVGDNTIWSDADGSMTATYLKKG